MISYAYRTEPSVGCTQSVNNLDRMVTENRLDYVARMGRDLVVGIQDICWEADEGGNCLGIHGKAKCLNDHGQNINFNHR